MISKKSDTIHLGLADYCKRNPIEENLREDGSIVWIFDQQYRICCWPAANGDVVFESRIMELPDEVDQCEKMLKEALECAAHRIHNSSEALVLSENGRFLMIQQRILSSATSEIFESCLEKFVNATANWRQAFNF